MLSIFDLRHTIYDRSQTWHNAIMRPWLPLCLVSLAACSLPSSKIMQPPKTPEVMVETGEIMTTEIASPETGESVEVESGSGVFLAITKTLSGSMVIGDPLLPRLTIITDPTCEYCQTFSLETLPWILKENVRSGDLSLEYLFVSLGAESDLISRTLLCASTAQDFLTLDHELAARDAIASGDIDAIAKARGIPRKPLLQCTQSKEVKQMLVWSGDAAKKLAVTKVPTFFFEDQRWEGLEDEEVLRKILEH